MVYLVILHTISLASATRSSMVSYHIAVFTESGLYLLIHRMNLLALIFTARRSYVSMVLGVVILFVRPSVCHTRAL